MATLSPALPAVRITITVASLIVVVLAVCPVMAAPLHGRSALDGMV